MAGNLIGGTAGTIFAVIGMMIVMGMGGLNGAPGGAGFGISTGGATSAFGSAVNLINTAYPYINGGMQIYQSFALDRLQDDMEDFLSSAREKYDMLRDAWDMIGPSGNVDPINLTARANDWYIEDAGSYYARSLNANPGIISYDLIQNFANMGTALPDKSGSPNIVDVVFTQFERQRGQV